MLEAVNDSLIAQWTYFPYHFYGFTFDKPFHQFLPLLLNQHHPREFWGISLMFNICLLQYSKHWLHVTVEYLKCVNITENKWILNLMYFSYILNGSQE